MYNDVDMVWLADPFPYLLGDHDVYFTDDMTAVSTHLISFSFMFHYDSYIITPSYINPRNMMSTIML
jgi:hypothetical protein